MNVNLIIFIKAEDSDRYREEIIDYYNTTANQIMKDIKEFADIHTLIYTNNSNVISLSANWKRERLKFLTNKILKITGINNLLIFPDHIEELNDALEVHDFFKVVAYSSTLLEAYGKQILIRHYEKQNRSRDHSRIGGLNFNATTIMLYSSGIIDKSLFENINDIRRSRNNEFIHRTHAQSILLSMKKVEEMEDIAKKAIRSVSDLKAKCEDMNK